MFKSTDLKIWEETGLVGLISGRRPLEEEAKMAAAFGGVLCVVVGIFGQLNIHDST